MPECTNPAEGALLHAYELHGLSEDDTKRFELHMMRCDYCLNEVRTFQETADCIVSDPDVREIIQDSATKVSETRSRATQYLRYLWPETPLVFRPALIYLVILLMIVPAYWGLRNLGSGRIRTIQTIELFPDRSTGKDVFQLHEGGEGLIGFLYRDAVPGEAYHVVIETDEGEMVFSDDSYDAFNEFGVGHLAVSLSEMKPGRYRLTITDPRAEPPLNSQEYRFKIEE
jgi:hypothetical protein